MNKFALFAFLFISLFTSCSIEDDTNDFIYEIDGQQRTVAVVNTVYTIDNSTCAEDPEEVTVHFDFHVTSNETYIFKFYQGEDEQGTDQYYIVEVPVMDERAISIDSIKN